jgi:hypothetical protein
MICPTISQPSMLKPMPGKFSPVFDETLRMLAAMRDTVQMRSCSTSADFRTEAMIPTANFHRRRIHHH